MADMPEPKWHGDDREWKRNIRWIEQQGGTPQEHLLDPITRDARAVAIAVFHAAADYNTLYRAPLEVQVRAWGGIFERERWLTIDLAERAVHAHFAGCADGRMLPFHVVSNASLIRLESEANGDA